MRTAANLKFGGKVKIKNNNTSNASHRRIIEVAFTLGEETKLLPGLHLMIQLTFSLGETLAAIRKKEVIKNYGFSWQTLK